MTGIRATAAVAATFLFAPALAQAQDDTHWFKKESVYAFGTAGYSILEDSSVTSSAGNAEIETDGGWGVLGGLGYDIGPVRLELEGNARSNEADQVSVLGTSASGDIDSYGLMANLWLDWDMRQETGRPLIPYLGGGLGWAHLEADGIATGGTTLVDDSDDQVAFQWGTGFAYGLGENVQLTVDYRYYIASDPEFTDTAGGRAELDYDSHLIGAGLRWYFNPRS